MVYSTYSATHLTVATQQTFTFGTIIVCKYVDPTTHATVFNLQLSELCKEAWLSIKFTHAD